MNECLLLIGLGNPGNEYLNNRHNVGFRIVEALAKAYASNFFKKMTPIVETVSFQLDSFKIILAKPQTFMNLSGRAVRFLIDFYKIPTEKLFVFHDDIDLDFSRVKVKLGGGNGGHNGLKSIDALVSNDYWRIRVGIGRPAEKTMVSSYVLSDFDNEQEKYIKEICENITKNLPLLFSDNKQFALKLNTIKTT